MARYRVYRIGDGELVLDVQSNIVDGLDTRVVAPLIPIERASIPADRLNPIFELDGLSYSMMTEFLSSVPASMLHETGHELSREHDRIVAALDMLFHGF
ncbi:MAG: plasmid maintenance protein CcdB [Ahrensia sp.]|nr:plasmid maintenance protein CcdB [Ahrensia sp.]|tara:strand:+ start:7293 stop:7589 length:297 start_codon:yes stop_codon:yes gene_type:complete